MINVFILFEGNSFYLQLKPDDNIKTLIEEVKIRTGYRNIIKCYYSGSYIKRSGKLYITKNSHKVEDENKTISELNIINNSRIDVFDPKKYLGSRTNRQFK